MKTIGIFENPITETLYAVYQKIEGISLNDWVKEKGPIDAKESTKIFKNLLEILQDL